MRMLKAVGRKKTGLSMQPEPEKIRVSLTLTDDLLFPIERRGYETNIPRNVDDRAAVAKAMGETVERTARVLMGLSIGEEN
jgi:hypothetical protein